MTAIRRRSHSAPEPSCVVGIDQSYSGFAVVMLQENLEHRVVRKGFAPKSYGEGVDRLGAIEDWFAGVLAVFPNVRHIAMEGYSMASKFGREMSGELGYAVKRTIRNCRDLEPPICYPTIVPPSSVKKFATGKSNAKKELMIKAVFTKWGFDTSDDNEADAYVLARVSATLCGWGPEPSKYESEVLQNLRRHTEMRSAAPSAGRSSH